MSQELKHECGIFGVCGYDEAAESCKEGLFQLQHRGQEQAGTATSDENGQIHLVKGNGLVEAVLTEETKPLLPGNLAIGHNRYSTSGPSDPINAQPHQIDDPPLAFGSNGDIVPFNYRALRQTLEKGEKILKSENDGELLAHFLAFQLRQRNTPLEAIRKLMKEVVGAYSGLLLYDGAIFAFRDPLGVRPLVLGEREGAYLVSSETCALDIVRANFLREIEPGETIILKPREQPRSCFLTEKRPPRRCVFELIYFSRPDSIVFSVSAHDFRKRCGALSAKKDSLKADVVMAVPDSSVSATIGYHNQSGIELDLGLIRNHYVGRTFIEAEQKIRDYDVRRKINPIVLIVRGKVVIIVDDSLVRGTTARKLVRMLYGAGAKEVHLRIASPPMRFPCFYGVDTKDPKELIAAAKTIEEVRDYITAESLEYLTMPDLRQVIADCGQNPEHFCYACFDGNYPTAI